MVLLDTVVLSELRRAPAHPGLTAWLKGQADRDLYLSVITIGEIAAGIERQRERDPAFAADLQAWSDRLVSHYASRIVPFSKEAARIWGVLNVRIGHRNADLQIAATALEHGWSVVTRNISDFESVGVPVINPWDAPT